MGRAKKIINMDAPILRAVERTYRSLNRKYFKDKLTMPTIMLVSGKRRLGYWDQENNTIAISRETLTITTNEYKLKPVLHHEMAHQYVSEVLKANENEVDPHGPLFQQVCQNGADTSLDEVEESEFKNVDAIISKVEKLLKLANSSNVNEAENAVMHAERLMAKWNISSLNDENRQFAYRVLTEPTKKRNLFLLTISSLLSEHFFVRPIWSFTYNSLANKGKGKWGYSLEICGTPENLEIAQYVFEYVTRHAENAFTAFKKEGGYGTRINYMAGVVNGFNSKLSASSITASDIDDEGNECNDLVWSGDPKLDEYYNKRYPNFSSSSYSSNGSRDGFSSGYSTGQSMSLRMGVGSSGTGCAGLLN